MLNQAGYLLCLAAIITSIQPVQAQTYTLETVIEPASDLSSGTPVWTVDIKKSGEAVRRNRAISPDTDQLRDDQCELPAQYTGRWATVAIGPEDQHVIFYPEASGTFGEILLVQPGCNYEFLKVAFPFASDITFSKDNRLFASLSLPERGVVEIDVNAPENHTALSGVPYVFDFLSYSTEEFLFVRTRNGLGKISLANGSFELLPGPAPRSPLSGNVVDGTQSTVYFHAAGSTLIQSIDLATGVSETALQLDPNGEYLPHSEIDGLIAADDDGFYFRQHKPNRLFKVDRNGKCREIASSSFSMISDIQFVKDSPSGSIYVAHAGGLSRLAIKDTNIYDVQVTPPNGSDQPIALSQVDGLVTVTYWDRFEVRNLARSTLAVRLGQIRNTTDIQIAMPSKDIAILSSGFLLQAFHLSQMEEEIQAFTLGSPLYSMEVGSSGKNLLGLSGYNGNVLQLGAFEGTPPVFTFPEGKPIVYFDQLQDPTDMAVMADGRIAIPEYENRRIVAVDLDNQTVDILGDNLPFATQVRSKLSTSRDNPVRITISDDGDIYFASRSEAAIYRLNRKSTSPTASP